MTQARRLSLAMTAALWSCTVGLATGCVGESNGGRHDAASTALADSTAREAGSDGDAGMLETGAADASGRPDSGLQVVHRINCGGPALAAGGATWQEDSLSSPSPLADLGGNRVETAASPAKGPSVPADVPLALFETLRWVSGGEQLRYRLPRGAGTYRVRLYFVERAHEAPGSRLFNVDLDGERVLAAYDIYADAGAARTGVMRQWTRSYASSGETVVELSFGAADAPVISGVEILAGGASGGAPTVPTGLTATAGDGQVALSWSASSGDVLSYTVKRATTSGGPYAAAASSVTATSYTDTGLVNGTTYHYVVSAVGPGGESGSSNEATATPTAAPPGPQRLGLHVTAQELAIWRKRWAQGSTDAFVDARINEEKTRIISGKNKFMSDPSGHLWGWSTLPLDGDGCTSSTIRGSSQRYQAARMRDAAFFGLVTRDAAALDQVKAILVQQPAAPNVNFGDPKPWCPLIQSMIDAASPYFAITHSVIVSLFTYDYLQIAASEGLIAGFTAKQKAALDAWFTAWAYKLLPSAERKVADPFVDWAGGDYTLKAAWADPAKLWHHGPNTYQGGPKVHALHNVWNNRRASTVRYMAVAGVKFGDTQLQAFARRWLRDFIRYHVFPHGALGDMHRGWSDQATGLGYMTLATTHALTGVDALARAGDTSLYDLSTSVGAHDTAGAPHHGSLGGKSFLFLIQTLTRYSDGTFQRYNGSNELFSFAASGKGLNDRFIWSNIYYRDLGLSRSFYRGEDGMHPYKTTGNGGSDLNDAWSFPAPYLMWAGLEGQIWPYPTP